MLFHYFHLITILSLHETFATIAEALMTEQQFQFNFPSDQNFTHVKEGPSGLARGSGHSPSTCGGHQESSQRIGPDPSLGFCRNCRVPGNRPSDHPHPQYLPMKDTCLSLVGDFGLNPIPRATQDTQDTLSAPSHVTCYCFITTELAFFTVAIGTGISGHLLCLA